MEVTDVSSRLLKTAEDMAVFVVEVEAERLIGIFVEVQEMTVQNLNLMEVEGVADMSLKFQNFEEAKGERVLKTSEDMAVFVVEVQVERLTAAFVEVEAERSNVALVEVEVERVADTNLVLCTPVV